MPRLLKSMGPMQLVARLAFAMVLVAGGARAEPLVVYLSHTAGPDKGWDQFREEFGKRVAPSFPGAVLQRALARPEPFEKTLADVRALPGKPGVFVTGHTALAQAAAKIHPEVSVVLGTLADPVNLGFSDGSDPSRPRVTGFT